MPLVTARKTNWLSVMFSVMLTAFALAAGVATAPNSAIEVIEFTHDVFVTPFHQLVFVVFHRRVPARVFVFCGPAIEVSASHVKVCAGARHADKRKKEAILPQAARALLKQCVRKRISGMDEQ